MCRHTTNRFTMAQYLLVALIVVASNSKHGAAAYDPASITELVKRELLAAMLGDAQPIREILTGGDGWVSGTSVAPEHLHALHRELQSRKLLEQMGRSNKPIFEVYVQATTSNAGKPGDKARLLLVQMTMCSCKETIDDTLVLAGKPAFLSEQPIGKASHLSLLHGSKQILTAKSMYEHIQFGSVYGVAGSDRMIYEAVLTAFAAAIILCWTMNSTFVSRRSLSQKECVLLAVVLILSCMTHIGCVEPGAEIPIGPRSPPPVEELQTLAVDFHMDDAWGGMLFLHEYELMMSDNTFPLDTGHYFTPLEVARPLTWLTVGLPVRGMPRYASLLVRGDTGDNMGYLDGYGQCFVTSDAITAGVLPSHGYGCKDLGFDSSYRGLTNTPEGDIIAALEIEIGREVALEAAKVLAEYSRMPRTEANKEKARNAMRDLTVMVCEGPRINRIGDIMRNSWTTRTRLPSQAVVLIFRWFILSTHKCLGNPVVVEDEGGDKLIQIQITTMADIDRELGMVKYVPACEGQRFPRMS